MKFKSSCIATAVATALLTSACNASTDADGTENARRVSSDGAVEALMAADYDVAKLARETLAEALNVPIATIDVDSVRTVEWRDSSIGCPQPDRAYMQVITPGHKIALRVDGKMHFVHEANGRAMVCRSIKAAPDEATPISIAWAPQAAKARKDLAARLNVDEQHIFIRGASNEVWKNSALGCEEPGKEYEAGTFEGYVLRLRHGNRDYTYHTDMEQVIACPMISVD